MKTIAVIINVGNMPFADLALKANEKYYNHFGIEMHVVTEHIEQTKNTSPVWMKSFLHDMFDADMIIAQDLDILPCNLKYNIEDFLIKDEFSFAVDTTMVGQRVGSASFPYFRYNAGLSVIPKRHSELMKKVFEIGVSDPHNWHTYDQYYLNEHIGEHHIFVNELPQIFNWFFNPTLDMNKLAFCHYTNFMATPRKREYILKHHPKEMLE